MELRKKFLGGVAASGFIALCAAAGNAQAGNIPGAPVLDPVSVNGVVEISLADYAVVLTAPGTKFLNPPIFIPNPGGVASAGCTAAGICNYGTGIISATLGANPMVLLGATPANGGGGDSSLFMSYEVEYYDPGVKPGTTIGALVHTSDEIMQGGAGDSAAQAVMTVSGINGGVYTAYNCATGPGAAFGCSSSVPNAPFADQAVTLVANTIYDVDLSLMIYAKDPVQVSIDPTFTAPAADGGEFIFSPGITSGVPEPATWAVMLAGFAGVGCAMRSSRRRPKLA
jgi:hypothetical protein